jgi:hypothetical protein
MTGKRLPEGRWKNKCLLMPAWVLESFVDLGVVNEISAMTDKANGRRFPTTSWRKGLMPWKWMQSMFKILKRKMHERNNIRRGIVLGATNKDTSRETAC